MPTTPSSSSSGSPNGGDISAETPSLGKAPAVAAASIYGSLAHSTSLMYQNAVAAQQQQTMAGTVLAFGAVLQSLARTAPDAKTAASGITDAEAVLKFVKSLQPGQ